MTAEPLDVINCLRVFNERRIKHLRRMLLADLLEVTNVVDGLGALEVTELREHLGQLMDAARTT